MHAWNMRTRLMLATLLSANFMIILDVFIVNVSLPHIQADLGASDVELQLVIVVYSLAFAALLMNGARFGDLYGRRRTFLAGLVLFGGASLGCGVAPSSAWLITARAIQGIAAALLLPQVYAMLRLAFDGEERRRAFAAMGVVQGLAGMLSQLTGAVLIKLDPTGLGWRLVFLVNLPVVAIGLAFGRILIEETRAPVPIRLDLGGALLGSCAVVLLLLPLMVGREYGWPLWSIAFPALAAVTLVGFLRYETRLANRGDVPIVDPHLFREQPFVIGIVAVFLFYSAISSLSLSLTLYIQIGLSLPVISAALVFTPSAVAFFCGSLAVDRLEAATGGRALTVGCAVFAVGAATGVAAGGLVPGSVPPLILAYVLAGAGQGVVVPLALNTVMSRMTATQAGMSAGVVSTLQMIGSATGVAVVGVVFFAVLDHQSAAGAPLPERYASAFSLATLYNLAALLASLALFGLLVPVRAGSAVEGAAALRSPPATGK